MIGAWKQFGWEGLGATISPGDETTYRMAEEFLAGLAVEDWGCGPGWFKTIHKGPYIGVDGTKTAAVDVVADLATYRSWAEGILLRHVLEHNFNWVAILRNAIGSFQKRLVVIVFTLFATQTTEIGRTGTAPVIPDLSLDAVGFVDEIRPWVQRARWNLKTKTQYGVEHLFLLERP